MNQPSLFPPPQSTQPPPVRVIDERDTAALEWAMVALWQLYPYPEACAWPREYDFEETATQEPTP